MTVTRIAAWNLHHATNERVVPESFYPIIDSLELDVLVLTEYVDGTSRGKFKERLGELGFGAISTSDTIRGQNHVLIASKVGHSVPVVPIRGPQTTEAACTNFLHRSLPDLGLDVVGFRVPDYKPAADRSAYWAEFKSCVLASSGRPVMFIGDFNWDPVKTRTSSARAMREIEQAGFSIVTASEPWSFINAKGTGTSKIDHAILAPGLKHSACRYVSRIGDLVLAGPSRDRPVSDHALLCVEVTGVPRIRDQ